VFAFHGLGDSKDLMAFYTQLDRVAEREHFILVYPNGTNKMWPIVEILAKDDLDYFDTLYRYLTERYNIDLRRVYLTGMSNGAFFSNLVASKRPDKVAAIASHSGNLGFLAIDGIKVRQKYAVLLIQGENDRLVKVADARKSRDLYQKWGHPVEYIEVPNHGHLWAHKVDINKKIWKFFEDHPLGEDGSE
jgi:polyhydroxybutyrate depolymerase